MMTTALFIILGILSIPFTLVGLLVFFQIARGKKKPMDTSNRINHIRLVWFALSRPELFVELFPWLKNDEYDNISS